MNAYGGFSSDLGNKLTAGRQITDPLEKAVTRYSFTARQEQARPTRKYTFPIQARTQTAEDIARLAELRERRAVKSPFAPF
ncbi:hypothetical protein ADL27_32405 [Streptomyces sp. NRRL F-6602]|nr:hypothetical protein ADL27_32405 [Streptomyces sp. NRRL F-6602]